MEFKKKHQHIFSQSSFEIPLSLYEVRRNLFFKKYPEPFRNLPFCKTGAELVISKYL